MDTQAILESIIGIKHLTRRQLNREGYIMREKPCPVCGIDMDINNKFCSLECYNKSKNKNDRSLKEWGFKW